MMGEYDLDNSGGQHAHDQVPNFKIGDLGIIRSFRPHSFGNHLGTNFQMTGKVEARMIGNYWCFTPEQFTRKSPGWPRALIHLLATQQTNAQ